jgi:hypothetical protein
MVQDGPVTAFVTRPLKFFWPDRAPEAAARFRPPRDTASRRMARGLSWFETAQARQPTMQDQLPRPPFAFNADATRLTGGRPSSRLISLVAASSLAMSTPVAMPMPSSM